MRDLIAVILAHGELARRFGNGFREGVGAAVTQIEGVVNLTPAEVARRARHLEHAGFLSILDDGDGLVFLALTEPRVHETGWDILADLKQLAGSDTAITNRAVLDLDFTVLDA